MNPTFQIKPLTAKERRRFRRPSFLVFKKSIRFIGGIMAFLCLVGCLALTGCHTNSSGWPVIPFMNNGGSQRSKATSAPVIALTDAEHLRLLTPQPDPAFQRPSANPFDFNSRVFSVSIPPSSPVLMVMFDAPPAYDGFNLYGGSMCDRSDWHLIITTNATKIPIQTQVPGHAFYGLKAFYRNGIDGAITESNWATAP